jgi:hypothetical protein
MKYKESCFLNQKFTFQISRNGFCFIRIRGYRIRSRKPLTRRKDMQSSKRYTNQTFTKRVDHEAGRHHTQRAAPEPEVCGLCGAFYRDKRWITPETIPESKKPNKFQPPHTTVCPACRRQLEGTPSGYLYIKGTFLKDHREDIEKLLQNEAKRAAEDNPLARIMGRVKSNGQITVTTTTEHLAQRLGHALEKAYGGEVRYDFSHENKLAHVWWQRD